MNKQDKKFEKELIKSLTQCCEQFKPEVDGFEWLTHTLNFSNIEQSIRIVCVFESNLQLSNAIDKDDITRMSNALINCLNKLGITIKKPTQHIIFDSEENCHASHQGNWQQRLNQQYS